MLFTCCISAIKLSLCHTLTVADPDISFGGPRGAEGAEGGGAWGGGSPPHWGENFFNLLLKNGVFWSILMSKCASHV